MKKLIAWAVIAGLAAGFSACSSPTGNGGGGPQEILDVRVTGLAAPVRGTAPAGAAALGTGDASYSVQGLNWSPDPGGAFAADTPYTAAITLKAAAGYRFAGNITPTVDAGTASAGTITGDGAENTLSFTVSFLSTGAVPTTGIALGNVGDLLIFPAAMVGYGAQTAQNITIINTGNQPTGNLMVTLSGTDSASFTLNKTTIDSIAVSGNDSFTVVPNTGLVKGTYTATVTVSGDNITDKEFGVSFTVNPHYLSAISITGLVKPVTGAAPGTIAGLSGSTDYTVQSIVWKTGGVVVSGNFAAATSYTATIVLQAGTDYQFTGTITPTVDAGTALAGTISGTGPGNTLTFTVNFPATTGLVGITITAWVNEDDTLVTDLPVSTTLSRGAGDTLAVEAAAGLTDIQWSLNEADIPAPAGTAQSVSLAAVNYPAGAYNLGLRVKKGGVPYSLELEFTVTN
jgi:hypothetical protein